MLNLHFFNPGHEMAILNASPHYTPTKMVQAMRHDLAFLPAWYANAEDFVFVEKKSSPRFFSKLTNSYGFSFPRLVYEEELLMGKVPFKEPVQARPWGITPQSALAFEQFRKEGVLPPVWKEDYRLLTGRQTAARCLEKIKEIRPSLVNDIEIPVFCSSLQEVVNHMGTHRPPFVLKQPYSSSGRGLLWIDDGLLNVKDKEWIQGSIRRQGSISIEPALLKRIDFAMEFYADGKGSVIYKGLSVISNSDRGKFRGCALATEELLENNLCYLVPREELQEVRLAVTEALQSVLGSVYEGYLGVDMLVYQRRPDEYRIHPLLEINLRYTMGLLALEINRRHIARNTGVFNIEYFSKSGDALFEHKVRQQAYYPQKFEGNKLIAGYLSLCPVNKDTHYLATILLPE